MEQIIKNIIDEHTEVMNKTLAGQESKIEQAALVISDCYRNKGKVILCGNGGSAADAQHIAAELVGKFKLERKSLAAITLTANSSVLSALANDYGFNMIFERQIEGLVNNNDVIIGISTSGNSENVIKGMLKAKEIGAKNIALTGEGGGKMKDIADVLIEIPSTSAPRIQEAHITVGHIICELVEKNLFKEN